MCFVDGKLVHRLFTKLSVGDWFLLYTMAPHMEM
jgi:hypothetical protein